MTGAEVLTVPAGGGHLTFAPGSGWAAYIGHDYSSSGPHRLLVRFAPADSGERAKLVAAEIHVSRTGGVGGRAHRDLPLACLESAVNQPACYEAVRHHLPTGEPDLHRIPEAGAWLQAGPPAAAPPELRLVVPDSRPKPDDFYRQVAEVFGYLTTVSNRPADDLAETNGVRTTTVHGWVKEARKRGFLPNGERTRKAADDG